MVRDMTVSNAAAAKVALVTGASSGMGAGFVKALLLEGMSVYAAARRVEQMAELAALGATTLRMDIASEADIAAVAGRIAADGRGVDILVNNAGFGLYGAMEDIPIEDARRQFEVNLFGMARLTQLLLPGMRARRSGRIINISSMGGRIYTPLGSWYHASKHAVEGWSDCLRLELAGFGIDVVLIEPGNIRTEFGAVMLANLLRHAEGSAYRGLVDGFAARMRRMIERQEGSDPQVVVDLLLRAVRARRPRTRYVGGAYARPLLLARKWLGDRMFDRIIRRAAQ
jgi:short-subunit dehydrogenase